MNTRIEDLKAMTTATEVTPEQFRQLALIVLEIAQEIETKQNKPIHAGIRTRAGE